MIRQINILVSVYPTDPNILGPTQLWEISLFLDIFKDFYNFLIQIVFYKKKFAHLLTLKNIGDVTVNKAFFLLVYNRHSKVNVPKISNITSLQ